jgi:hypothetical protein
MASGSLGGGRSMIAGARLQRIRQSPRLALRFETENAEDTAAAAGARTGSIRLARQNDGAGIFLAPALRVGAAGPKQRRSQGNGRSATRTKGRTIESWSPLSTGLSAEKGGLATRSAPARPLRHNHRAARPRAWKARIAPRVFGPIRPSMPPVEKPRWVSRRCICSTCARVSGCGRAASRSESRLALSSDRPDDQPPAHSCRHCCSA